MAHSPCRCLRFAAVIFLLSVALTAIPAAAATRLVRPDGTGAYATIQAAINAAANGDTVLLAAGTFRGNGNRDLSFSGKAIVVRSQAGDPAVCIIDCEGGSTSPHRGFWFQSNEGASSILEGVTIRGGYATSRGGGILIEGGTATLPTIHNCVLTDNTAADGAGIAVYGDENYAQTGVNMSGCEISGNHGVGAQWGQNAVGGLVTSCRFVRNQGPGLLTQGVVTVESGLDVQDCLIAENAGTGIVNVTTFGKIIIVRCVVADNAGYGLTSLLLDSGVRILDSEFRNNYSGGLYCPQSDAGLVVTDCLIHQNHGDGVGYGGDHSLYLYACTIRENAGNGIHLGFESVKSMAHEARWNLITIDDCQVGLNGLNGICLENGLMNALGDASLLIIRCTVYGNSLSGIYLGGGCNSGTCLIRLKENTIVDNASHGLEQSCDVPDSVSSNLIAFNGGHGVLQSGATIPVLSCSDMYGNTQGDWAGSIAAQAGLRGNVAMFPSFCDRESGDYALYSHSRCLAGARGSSDCGLIGALAMGCNDPPHVQLLGATGNAGSACTISAVLVDSTQVTGARLYYRSGGQTAFNHITMSSVGGSVWRGIVPSNDMDARGLQYYVVAYDSADSTLSPALPILADVAVSVAEVAITTLPAREYQFCSVPIIPSSVDPTSLFSELGPYGEYDWRYVTWDSEQSRYLQYPQAEAVRPGLGFWIIAAESRSISASGLVPPLSRPFPIALNHGWNQIANPFAFPVAFTSLGRPAGADDDLIGYCASCDTIYQHALPVLEPGRGYWLYNNGPADTLRVPPVGASTVRLVSNRTLPVAATGEETGWRVDVQASAGDLSGGWARVGVRAGATSERDKCDLLEPPPPPQRYVSVAAVSKQEVRLHCDYRGEGSTGETWIIEMASDLSGMPYSVRLQPDGRLPADWRLLAIDDEALVATDVSAGGTLTGEVLGTRFFKRWRLAAGPEAYVNGVRDEVDAEFSASVMAFALEPPSPNPGIAGTGVITALAAPRDAETSVRVYDARGRLVDVIQSGSSTRGLHRLRWAGTDVSGRAVAAGVYFLRLRAPGVDSVHKVTIVR